jgi:YesN/AraC family two-component response regulator
MHQTTLNLLKNFSLLVVEDDEIALMMIKQALKPYVGSLYTAKDGFEGLELFKKYRVDMIVTDIHLPGINGFEMIKEIQILKPEQLFIVMTSFDTDQNIIHSMHEGACNFLRKPIDIKELQTALLMVSSRISCHKTTIRFFGYCATI